MNLNALRDRLDMAEDELKRLQGSEPDAAREVEKRRMVAVASLCSSVCVAIACGQDAKEAAARCAGRLRAIPEEEWPAFFDEARDSMRRTSSEREWPARSAVLEEVIEAALQPRSKGLSTSL